MSIYAVLRSRLVTEAGVAALVSNRVYPGYLPQNPTYPAITYQRVSNTPRRESSAWRSSRWQINCYGANYTTAVSVAAAVKAALEGWSDTDQAATVKQGRVVNETDNYEPDVSAHRIIVDVLLDTLGD